MRTTMTGIARRGALCCAVAIAMCFAQPAFATRTMVAVLSGSQEVPQNNTQARGAAWLVIDTNANTLQYRIAFSGLMGPETAAHFHGPAAPGVNAGILQPLPLGNPKVGVWNYPEAQELNILRGLVYINIHSTVFPGGEIRGQVVDMAAEINAIQEVPPVPSPNASGIGLFMIDTVANRVEYYITFSGLMGVETAAHIHGFALHGANAGILHPLPLGSPKVGTWNYAEADEAAILEGRTYTNIHSTLFGGGEIRGQNVRVVAPLDGQQEVPPSVPNGHGAGLVAINTNTDQLSYYLRYQNLTGAATNAHIHGFAPPGGTAGVLHNIGIANPAIGTWNYGGANEPQVLAGLTYFNVHTAAFPNGEVRGQINFPFTRKEGACCLPPEPTPCGPQPPDPDCIVTDPVTCALLGGVFLGPNVPCEMEILEPIHTSTQWSHVIRTVSNCGNEQQPGGIEGPVEVDPWYTVASESGNCEDFGNPDSCPIPAGFFGPGSDPFTGTVCFCGEPIGPITLPGYPELVFSNADTIVMRAGDPFDRCTAPSTAEVTVPIELVSLNLVSINPITVTFNGGMNPRLYDVAVEAVSSFGTLTAVKTHCNGGTFDSTLQVCPRFIFTPVDGVGSPVMADFCTGCDPDGIVMVLEDHPWVVDTDPNVVIDTPTLTDFHPGILDTNQQTDCDCNGNGRIDSCEVPGDANGDGAVGFPDLLLVLSNWDTGGPVGDLDCDGIVGFGDLLLVLSNWTR
jgi:hypothetical protein